MGTSGTSTATRILCVDDHELLADGLAGRMSLERDLEWAGRLPTADSLVEEAQSRHADIVLLDLDMPGRDPMEALVDLQRSAPGVKVMILSALLKDNLIDQAVQRGASGYFLKTDSPAEILQGIREIASGRTAFSPAVQERLITSRRAGANGPATPLQSLTPRELEVLRLIGQGLSRAEIARRLYRSLKTIDAHHTSIMRKLNIHDRAELTRYVIREGLAEA